MKVVDVSDIKIAVTYIEIATPTTSPTAPVLTKDISVTYIVPPVAITTTSVLPCEEAKPVTPTVKTSVFSPTYALIHTNTTPYFSLPPLDEKIGSVSCNNQDSFSLEILQDVDLMPVSFQRTLQEWPVKPTQKVQDRLEWTMIKSRGKRGRGRGERVGQFPSHPPLKFHV